VEVTDSNGWNAGPLRNLSLHNVRLNAAVKTVEGMVAETVAGMEEEDFRGKLEARS